jgi:hypothetical protein
VLPKKLALFGGPLTEHREIRKNLRPNAIDRLEELAYLFCISLPKNSLRLFGSNALNEHSE